MAGRACRALTLLGLAVFLWPHCAQAQTDGQSMQDGGVQSGRDLYLEVMVNGVSAGLVAAFHEDPDGTLAIAPDQLRNVGIAPARDAVRADGLIQIDRLPAVGYQYDELSQTIAFTAADGGRAARVIDAAKRRGVTGAEQAALPQAQSSYGALLNYSLVASTDNSGIDRHFAFGGFSGAFEGRVFSPYGVLSQTFIASTSRDALSDSTRLETVWSYSDPGSMTTYRAGDLISSGLGWTRPTRLGGIQIQRNFALRSDLITFPIPELSGSAAVPSTVDVYLNNARRFSSAVPAGPFEIINLPIVTGTGMARVVVRDAQGQEVITESAFLASSELLTPGLFDFSVEAGFARKFFGTDSNVYDERPMGSASLRYGLTNWATLEGHAEGGAELINAGGGVVFAVAPFGVASLAGATSYSEAGTGYLAAGSLEMDLGMVHVAGRMQRTFGQYHDIASITSDSLPEDDNPLLFSSSPPKALDQVSVSVPLIFDPSYLNVSFTRLETFEGDRQRLLGLSYSRPVFNGSTFSVSAFKELEDEGRYGLFASLSIPLGGDISSTLSASSRSDEIGVMADVSKSQGQQVGDYGWRVRYSRAEDTVSSAAGSYRAPFARVAAAVEQQDEEFQATAKMDGAIVAAGGGIFISNRINDAFAIVDAGAPGVEVLYENRPAGITGRNGKLLLPRLRSYENNRISIDPTNLPLDAVVNSTRDVVVPADRSGIVVRFDVDVNADAALVTFRDAAGSYIEMGAIGQLGGAAEPFVIGYDGQAYVEGLSAQNRITMERRDGSTCTAELTYKAGNGEQVSIPDAICQP